ncbi:peptidase [Paenibacillus selenitireducens]|uniref:Peptidase n=1 Tax=Paenibacillus selenitireducens TaxID=1324314 RepID=A0A1T2XDJ0_9BACL|nr:M13-type metalloendopeptidase [Paenibacillus selenitireducens]OPA77746.1 peptidase [Paenibacillus selenitireducens]
MKKLAVWLCTTLLITMLPLSAFAQETESYVTRGQVVDYLLNAADDYNPAVKKEDILKGYGQGNLNEDQPVSRIEALIMLNRAFSDLPAPKGNDLRVGNTAATFTDIPAWAQPELAKLTAAGVVSGYPDGRLGVSDKVTSEQLRTFVNRVIALEGSNARDDYYEFINKKWLNDSTIPAGEMGNGVFNELMKTNDDKIKDIIDELVKKQNPQGSKEQKIADYYKSALDAEQRNKQGIEPIAGYLRAFDNATSLKELFQAGTDLEVATGIGTLLQFAVMADAKNSSTNALYATGLAAGLDKNSYVSGDEKTKNTYINYIAQLFVLSGEKEQAAKEHATAVFNMEKELASASLDIQDQGDVNKYYNLYAIDKFTALYPTVDVAGFLKSLQLSQVDKIIVTDVGLAKKSAELLKEENLGTLKSYAKARLLMSSGALLSDKFREASNQFSAQMYGIEGKRTDEQIAVSVTKSALSDYLGQAFAEKHFSKEAKKDVEQMVHSFVTAYEKRIQSLDWMSDATKAKAIKKLEKMTIKIGYPDQWKKTLDQVSISTYDKGGSLFANTVAISLAKNNEQRASLGKAVDKSDWIMSVYDVNAYYNPLNNEIVFPAGILQSPFYDIKAKQETNLGAIGMVIAHEISHAFDNLGSAYDENGNANNWWTAEDLKKFQEKCNEVIAYYDRIEVVPGAYNNGQLTVSENIADLGGMAASLQVVSQLANPDYKAYFEGNAIIWRSTMTREIAAYLTTVDTHSANKVRVNRTVSNFPEFYKTYGVTEKDAMYVAPEKRVSIW